MIQKLSPATTYAQPTTLSNDAPRTEFTARWIDSVDELESLYPLWQRLMDTALHRNLMFDPDFLIPAFKHFADGSVRILVIEAPVKNSNHKEKVLCGLFPLQAKRIYAMPLQTLEVWAHQSGVDNTPLLRSDCASEVLNFVFDYLAMSEKTKLFSLDTVANFGPIADVLTDVLYSRKLKPFHRDSFSRASFRPEQDAETYFDLHVSKTVQKTQRRLARRMEQVGEVSVICYRDPEISDALINDFLRLEASGWKFKAGTAIQCDPRAESFFREMVTRSLQQNKLAMLTLKLDGKPIAMLCDLYSGGMGYAYKTAFDISQKEFSPGQQLELKNIEFLHQTNVCLLDSCTAPDNQTINRIWGQRIRFQSLVIPLGGAVSRLAVAAMPLMQQFKRA